MSCLFRRVAGLWLNPFQPHHHLVEGVGFEPTKAEPADLQSALVDRLSTPPVRKPRIV